MFSEGTLMVRGMTRRSVRGQRVQRTLGSDAAAERILRMRMAVLMRRVEDVRAAAIRAVQFAVTSRFDRRPTPEASTKDEEETLVDELLQLASKQLARERVEVETAAMIQVEQEPHDAIEQNQVPLLVGQIRFDDREDAQRKREQKEEKSGDE